jgi:hypothetical protein
LLDYVGTGRPFFNYLIDGIGFVTNGRVLKINGQTGRSIWRAALALCGLVLCASCTRPASTREPSQDVIRQYLRLAVALGERDPDSLDYYYGPEDWVADLRTKPSSFAEIRKSALSLAGRLEAPQSRFLIGQLQAIAARVDLLTGVHRDFDAESQALFGVTLPPWDNPARLVQVRQEINALLPGSKSLADRYAAFDGKYAVPPDRVPAVMKGALDACREQTRSHIGLPEGESVTVEFVANKPWDAYSTYRGHFRSLIQINTDFPLTVDRALELACHEGYPGHHVYNTMEDADLVQREGRKELMVQPTFSPQSFASEAAATIAAGVAFPPEERLRFERDTLFPLAGLDPQGAERYLKVARLVDELAIAEAPIARDYLDGRLEFVRAGAALEEQALMAHSEATLKYINEYRTYMLAYTLGKERLWKCLRQAEKPWQAYQQMIVSATTCAP